MIDKFKEKKKNVVDALIEGIDAMMKVVGTPPHSHFFFPTSHLIALTILDPHYPVS